MRTPEGTTLIEALVGITILGAVFTFITGTFVLSANGLSRSKFRVLATALANEHIETLRNLPYDQLGTSTGVPSGSIDATQTVTRSNIAFTLATRIDWVDDPFDGNAAGTIVGKPVDTAPTDYKKMQVTVSWNNGSGYEVRLTSTVSPKGLESPSNTGSLLITVFDANGQPVPEADVTVTNTNLIPNVNIATTTDIYGNLQLLGLSPDLNKYHVQVSKAGYTTDTTLAVSGGNPNPVKPDLSIIAGAITNSSFSVDRVSSLAVSAKDALCAAVPSISFNLKGQELTGNPPPNPVLAYDVDHTTNGAGTLAIPNLHWDNYSLTLNGAARNIIGIIPPTSLNVQPNTNADLTLVVSDTYSNHSLLASVKDANTGLAISGATVRLVLGGYDESRTTGQGAWSQTNWAGGAGQENVGDLTKYQSDDSNVDVTDTPGQVSLEKTTSTPNISDTFTDTTNRDAAATTAVWDTGAGELRLPQTSGDYDPTAEAQTIKLNTLDGKVTQATLTVSDQANGQTIAYALSADGANFENVTPGSPHTFAQTGSDLRLRVDLASTDVSVTPQVFDVTVNYTIEAYAGSAELTSSTFDTGSASTFISLVWNPTAQAAGAGSDPVRFQIATNDDDATWNYLGPDGTAGTYYTTSGTPIATANQNLRYVRYRMFLRTDDAQFTPNVSDVAIGYTSGCTAPGQGFFGSLSNSTYQITISKVGYTTLDTAVSVNGNLWNNYQLTPL
ncbi:MAG: carboxypeptidase regulatory-like domain-containing protein [Patescibacteria group bacterium]